MPIHVFISYRRDDTDQITGRIDDHLAHRFGRENVFKDVDSIPVGKDFRDHVRDAINRSDVLLVIIGDKWLTCTNDAGRRRLDDEGDWPRIEIESALELGIPIIPVLIKSVGMPKPNDLPVSIRPISFRTAARVRSDPDFRPDIERLIDAIRALTGKDSPPPTPAAGTEAQTFFGKLRQWGRGHPSHLLALGLPPILFATWHLFRLPVVARGLPILVWVATGVLCAIALWVGSRLGALLLAAFVGVAFTLKPLLVPFEGGADGPFPYGSETAMTYWVPGVFFLVVTAVGVLTLSWSRLIQDFVRLRPGVLSIGIALITTIAAYSYFKRPTLYDVYLPFRPQYRLLREQLRNVARAVDGVSQPFNPKRDLEVPLVLDQTSRGRDEDASTTGHIFLYQHLTDPDAYFGEIEYAFFDDLHLHLRDTGPDPVLSQSVFAEFASELAARPLERAINAPYLVILKPLKLDRTRRVDRGDLIRAGPYRVFLYHLKRDEILMAVDVDSPVTTTDELKEAVYAVLERTVNAKILR